MQKGLDKEGQFFIEDQGFSRTAVPVPLGEDNPDQLGSFDYLYDMTFLDGRNSARLPLRLPLLLPALVPSVLVLFFLVHWQHSSQSSAGILTP